MPALQYALAQDEMIVPVVVGLGHTAATTQMQQGQPLPGPLAAQAIIDTGSSSTAVAPQIIQQLGLTPKMVGSSHTAGGPVAVRLYLVSVSVFDRSRAAMLTVGELLVSELTATLPTLPGVEVLIGMDILLGCKLLLDGPARRFALEF